MQLTCLGRERSQLEALVQVLIEADNDVAANAPRAASSLLPPGRCTDARALATLPPPPRDALVRKQVEEQHPYKGQLASVRFALAKALAAQHKEAAKVSGLAHQAHDELAAIPWRKHILADLEAWMKKAKIK